ncbi:MAG: DUF262 domain-containing protein [Deltaproteobacteria bacterium]|nr:DUF262 domain-containing protein [Deltaproteobacteria bacterium]
MAGEYLKAPTIERLGALLAQLKDGSIRIPPFQRQFVWSTEQRLQLMDSVNHGLPCGSLMLWRTKRRLPWRSALGPFALPEPPAVEGALYTYLLDGQQRMTSLFGALGAALWTQAEQTPLVDTKSTLPNGDPWDLWYDLSEGAFVAVPLEPDEDDQPTPALPLRLLLDDQLFDEWRDQASLERAHKRAARELQSSFRDYLIPTVSLVTEDMEAVKRTFLRINAGGTPMDDVNLARALTWTDEFDLSAALDDACAALEPEGWAAVPHELLLKVVAGLSGQEPFAADIEFVARAIRAGLNTEDELLTRATAGARRAAALLRRLDIWGPHALPYGYAFVLLAEGLADGPLPEDRELAALGRLLLQMHTERPGQAPPHVLAVLRRELQGVLKGASPWPRAKGKTKPPPRRVTAPGRFNLGWGRSRLAALALVSAKPRGVDGAPLDAGPLLAQGGTGFVPQLLTPGMADAPPLLREALAAGPAKERLRGVGNRVLLPPDQLAELRVGLFDGSISAAVLESHLINGDALQKLTIGDVAGFLKAREAAIVEAQRAQLVRFGVPGDLLTLLKPD